LRDLKKKTKI